MFFWSVSVALLLLLDGAQPRENTIEYEYDYDAIYDEIGEFNPDTDAALQTEAPEGVISQGHNHASKGKTEFQGRVHCTKSVMTLEVDRALMPPGLGFYLDLVPEKLFENDHFNPSTSCIRLTYNDTHFIYKVSLNCQRAVGKLIFDSMTVYSHEVLLTDTRVKDWLNNSVFYTVIMECETEKKRGDRDPWIWNPEYRLFEHRQGKACMDSSCRYGELCLPEESINGYFCQCPGSDEKCDCPTGFYGCMRNENASALTTSLICIRNDQLCDRRFDCPLQDDELCADVWTQWSAWSTCSKSCGKGQQVRSRTCSNSFTKDPSRCSKRCVLNHDSDAEQEERSCDNGACSSVHCGSESMVITIPIELGMTKKTIDERMHLRGTHVDNCLPVVNSTHVEFLIPLHECNTTTWVDGDLIFYSNEVVYEVARHASSMIIREFGHSYTAKCQYKRRQTVGLRRFEVNPGSKLLDVAVMKYEQKFADRQDLAQSLDLIEHHTSGDGEFEYSMDIFTDSSYASRYARQDYPLQKALGERLYVAVTFTSQDEDLHVFIEECWATASGKEEMVVTSDDDIKYPFISKGCPVDPTVLFHNYDNSHFSDRYSIEAFKFNDPSRWYVYFQCNVILCDINEEDPQCHRECGSKKTDESIKRQKRDTKTYSRVVQGPIVVLDESDLAKLGSNLQTRSADSVGWMEHKILKHEDVHDNTVGQLDFRSKSSGLWDSPVAAAAIVGVICMIFGVFIGLVLRRKQTTMSSKTQKSSGENREKKCMLVKGCEDDNHAARV